MNPTIQDFQTNCLPFEKQIVELEKTIAQLKALAAEGIDLNGEIKSSEKKLESVIRETFENLSAWQRVQVARHPLRPYTLDYIKLLIKDFIEVHGDRAFSDDKAIVCGIGFLGKRRVCVIGHQKGRDTKENLMRSFGSAHPEGYRKAMRVMRLASKFDMPIICLVDTPGAYPGVGAEERGQAEAIANNLREMAGLEVPIVVIVIGEGGSGGALGIGVGNSVLILENAYYSVISPEGCAAILWKDPAKAPDAAAALKLTGEDLLELGVVDEIIPEPLGGAHRNFAKTAASIGEMLDRHLTRLCKLTGQQLIDERYKKFRVLGKYEESQKQSVQKK